MANVLFIIGLILFFIFFFVAFIYPGMQHKWARTKADKIIEGSLVADSAYINGIIEILRPLHFWSVRHEDDLFRVQRLRIIRDRQIEQ